LSLPGPDERIINMDGQDGQDEERTDFRFEISNLLILPILPIHVNSSVNNGQGQACPYS
jgi:hypothetical protein